MKKIKIICIALCIFMLFGTMPVSATEVNETTQPTEETQPGYEMDMGDSSVVSGSHL